MHPHPNPLPSRERGNWIESMSVFGSSVIVDFLENVWYASIEVEASLKTTSTARGGLGKD